MKKLLILSFILLLGFFLTNISCDKNSPDPIDKNDTTENVLNVHSSYDASIATDIYLKIISDVLVKSDEETAGEKYIVTCPEVSIDPYVGYPKTLTIDYGNSCELNGHIYSGAITAVLSNRIRLEGSTVSITFSSVKMDSIEINGTISITVDIVNLSDNFVIFTSDFDDCDLVMQNGTNSFDANFSTTWFANTLTNYSDDVLEISSGTFSGVTKEDKTYDATILETLVFTAECKTIVQGEIKIETTESAYPATIDFGNGTCDHTAIVTTTVEKTYLEHTFTQEFSYEITIP